jgi:hypothetical protein
MLASRAVLTSVGVGDSEADPTSAIIYSVLQETAGRLATIMFAHHLGTALEPECKMWRLAADVLNDMGFVIDCLSPALEPRGFRVVMLSISGVLRSLCGVAAGSSKASLSAHFARWGNLGELNAKDSSQETVITLLGMLAGTFVVSWIVTPAATWTAMIVLLSIHLEMNRRAVRSVRMRTLNRQRATLVYHWLKGKGKVPTIAEISRQERIFEWDGVLRTQQGDTMGWCRVGSSVQDLIDSLSDPRDRKGLLERKLPAQFFGSKATSSRVDTEKLDTILETYRTKPYIITSSGNNSFRILLKKDVKPLDTLAAWWQVLALAEGKPVDAAMELVDDLLGKYEKGLREAGWELDSGALETRSSTRVSIEMQE